MPKSTCLVLVVIAACGAPAADPRDQRCLAPPPVPVSLDPDVQGTERLLPEAAFDVREQLGYGNGPLATFLDDDRLVYFRYRAGVRQVVVHALATHRERILPLAVSVLEVEPPRTDGWSRVWFTREPAALPSTDTSQRAIRWRACGGERTCRQPAPRRDRRARDRRRAPRGDRRAA